MAQKLQFMYTETARGVPVQSTQQGLVSVFKGLQLVLVKRMFVAQG